MKSYLKLGPSYDLCKMFALDKLFIIPDANLLMSISNFVILAAMLVVSALVWIGIIFLERFISPRVQSGGMSKAPIESAERSIASARTVGFQYFFYAIIFVVVEALMVLLFLWAQSARAIGLYVFLGVGTSLLYLIFFVRYLFKVNAYG